MKERLFEDFPPTLNDEWQSRIKEDLQGKDYAKRLIHKTVEGITIKPYYREDDLNELDYLETYPADFPYIRGNNIINNRWDITQEILVENFDKSNEAALNLTENGVDSISFNLERVKVITLEKFLTLLRDIDVTLFGLNFKVGGKAPVFLDFIKSLAKLREADPDRIKGYVDYDPLGEYTSNGMFYESEKDDFIEAKYLIKSAESDLPGYRVIAIDGTRFNNAGASIVQELGFSLAIGSEYLYRLTKLGVKVKNIIEHLQFNFGIGSNFFMEIAKFRAARLLWAKIVETYNSGDRESARTYIQAETSTWNKSIYDPYVNLLRKTTEAMSAIIGGVNSLTVNPYDNIYRESSDFSKRIARNVQHILKEEAYFDKIVDPSSGSYFIESITDSIAEKAWKIFLTIENNGGFLNAIKEGYIQSEVKKTAIKRSKNIEKGDEVLLGVNKYPNFDEQVKDEIDVTLIHKHDRNSAIDTEEESGIGRAAEEFEKLRLQTENNEKNRPVVFMLKYGDLVMSRARAVFASNFFACAGYKIINYPIVATIEEGVKEAINSKANIVVVCSSDNKYVSIVPKIYTNLGNNVIIAVAGYPDSVDKLKDIGIKHFIHKKSNLLNELKKFHRLLKVVNN
jgi:methylmalonyl-CoA mutase